MAIAYEWRGSVTSDELKRLHAEAFDTRAYDESDWNWRDILAEHSLGWVVARDGAELVGFVNVAWDGLVHAFILDTMVQADSGRQGVGTRLVGVATDRARAAGCEWLHVDFEEHLASFYFGACGFSPTSAGLIALRP